MKVDVDKQRGKKHIGSTIPAVIHILKEKVYHKRKYRQGAEIDGQHQISEKEAAKGIGRGKNKRHKGGLISAV